MAATDEPSGPGGHFPTDQAALNCLLDTRSLDPTGRGNTCGRCAGSLGAESAAVSQSAFAAWWSCGCPLATTMTGEVRWLAAARSGGSRVSLSGQR
jgi:hypothetical protein